jgi:hypothetical protein
VGLEGETLATGIEDSLIRRVILAQPETTATYLTLDIRFTNRRNIAHHPCSSPCLLPTTLNGTTDGDPNNEVAGQAASSYDVSNASNSNLSHIVPVVLLIA